MSGLFETVDLLPTVVTSVPTPLRLHKGEPQHVAANNVISRLNKEGVIGTPMSHFISYYPSLLSEVTKEALSGFVISLGLKLRQAEQKYRYTDGWANGGWMDECRAELRKHLEKGDPRDVAIYAMFLWYHGEPTN
jgi:hypothetical protein